VRISVLIPNLATNCIVRSWPIIKVLERHHEVEVIGSLFGNDQIFPLYAQELPYQVVRWGERRMLHGLHQVMSRIHGDLVYAFKPLTASLGAALAAKLRRRVPVILDVEDWETWSLYRSPYALRRMVRIGRQLLGSGWSDPHSLKYRYVMEQLAPLADSVTVVSTFLQRRFGGVKLPHGTDTTVFDPALYNKRDLRAKWGIDERARLLLFAGNPSPYKGLEDILEAIDRLMERGSTQLRLLMVGRSAEHAYTYELLAKAPERILHLGPQPHALMPELLALSDMVVLPQRYTPVTSAQVPAKVFEAMAMAKPIIATRMSDLPEVLDGCGILVEPEDVAQLTAAIERIIADEALAVELGERARERCLQYYSWDAMEAILARVLDEFLPG
jgi:glycosyltransferase involved in cell wall biosynthesis